MSRVLPGSALGGGTAAGADRAWLLAGIGWLAMYLPVYWWAANGIWQSEEQGHGALIPAVMLWLFWGLRKQIDSVVSARRRRGLGGLRLRAVRLLRRPGLSDLDSGIRLSSLCRRRHPAVPEGPAAVRLAWFALFYFIFMIPVARDHRRRRHRACYGDLRDRRRAAVRRRLPDRHATA